jgi:hypothetical protein
MRFLTAFGFTAGVWTLGAVGSNAQGKPASDSSHFADAIYAQNALDYVQNPLQMGAMAPSATEDFTRHRQEKERLMKRMDRKQGNWGTSHPRYRLMEALLGFSKYRVRSEAELDRWRDLYKNVRKKQKRVSGQ